MGRDSTERSPQLEYKTYMLESGRSVDMAIAEFTPRTEEHQDSAVLFMPGWSMSVRNEGVDALCRSFADSSRSRALSITTRTKERGAETAPDSSNFLMEEAEAVVRLIREKGLKQITLAGHSQGGDKAIDVAAILQKGTEVGVNGVILFDPVGIYEQTASQLARSFAKDTFINTPATLAKNVTQNVSAVHRGVVLATDIIFNIVKEMRDSGSEYWRRFKSELDEMSRRNPNIAEVRAPVVLMTGAADPVSDREHIVSAGDEAARREALGEEEGISDKTLAARESFLKEHVFVKSPYIRMLVPEKMGDHGMPLFRAQSAARASLYLLGRYHRNS